MVDNAICYNASITDDSSCNNATVAGKYTKPSSEFSKEVIFTFFLFLNPSFSPKGWPGHWRSYAYFDHKVPAEQIISELCIYPTLQTRASCEAHGLSYEVCLLHHLPTCEVH